MKDMKKIIVASDSFKGSLTSIEVANAVEIGIKNVFPQCNVIKTNVADGVHQVLLWSLNQQLMA